MTLDVGRFVDRPTDTFSEFAERLPTWLPGLQQHGCSLGRPGGFVKRLRRGTSLPHIAEHVALELPREMGFRVSFRRGHRTGRAERARGSVPLTPAQSAGGCDYRHPSAGVPLVF